MAVTAEIIHVSDDSVRNDEVWGQVVDQLSRYWDTKGAELFHRDFNLSAPALVEAWMQKVAIIVIAKDEKGSSVGMGIGIQFRNMFYSSSQLVLEMLQGDNQEAYNAILGVYADFVRLNGLDKVYVSAHKRDKDLLNTLLQAGVSFDTDEDIVQKNIMFKK